MLPKNPKDGTVEFHAGRWYYRHKGKWCVAPNREDERVSDAEATATLINALMIRTLWDYSHRRACFLASGQWAIRSGDAFIFGRDGIEWMSKTFRLDLDVERLRNDAVKWRDGIDERKKERRKEYWRRWKQNKTEQKKKAVTFSYEIKMVYPGFPQI